MPSRRRRPSAEEQAAEFMERMTPPEIPYDLVKWIRRMFPVVAPTHGKTIEEWEFLAGQESVVGSIEMAYQDQQEAHEAELRGEK